MPPTISQAHRASPQSVILANGMNVGMKCTACGAALPPGALQCAYCGTATALKHQQAAQQQYLANVDAHAARERAAANAASGAGTAFIFAALSIPCACLLVPAIVGLALGIRSVRLARGAGEPAPTKAIAAIVLSTLSLLMMIVGWTVSGLASHELNTRKAAVAKRVEAGAGAATLDQTTACALVEQRLLEEETEGISPTAIDQVHCDGKLTQTTDKATLDGVRFTSTSKGVTVIGCFTHGARWTLASFIKAGTCEHPIDPAALASSSASASATPSASASAAPSASASAKPDAAAPPAQRPGDPRDRSAHPR
jgi:hypothetical protein